MNFRFSHIILFLLITANIFCQDVIVKRDSAKIISKVFMFNSTRIKYIELSDINQRVRKIKKTEVSEVILRNGDRIIYKNQENKNKIDTSITIHIIEVHKEKKTVHDFFKFNVMGGIVINASDCNRPNEPYDLYKDNPTQINYFKVNNQPKIGANIGFNFLLGSSPWIKHILGVNYIKSDGEFKYIKSSNDTYYNKSSTQNFNIKSTDYYLNLVNGIRATVFKSFHIETSIAINIPTIHRSNVNGSITTNESGITNTYYVKDSIGKNSHVEVLYAFNPKICYEFKSKGHSFGIYAACNLNFDYKCSWYMFGITYYRFKKFS